MTPRLRFSHLVLAHKFHVWYHKGNVNENKEHKMLELHIMQSLMSQEARSNFREGRLQGFSVSYVQKQNEIPKATFYRAIKQLIVSGIIVKQKRNSYVISENFRGMCNNMLSSELVGV